MVYKKTVIWAIVISIVLAIVSNFTFASSAITANDKIMDTTLEILIFIQKYSWPVVTFIFIYAMYQFYVAGSEILEHKILGQRLIIGIAVFMVLVQCLPLVYAFVLVS